MDVRCQWYHNPPATATTPSASKAQGHSGLGKAAGPVMKRRFVWALAFAVPVFLLEMGAMLIPGAHAWLQGTLGTQNLYYVLFALTTVVQFGPGWYFYKHGWPALKNGAPDMKSSTAAPSRRNSGFDTTSKSVPGTRPRSVITSRTLSAVPTGTVLLFTMMR